MPGFLYKYSEFLTRFETPIVKGKNEEITARLKNMVGPFILRRLKTDVLKDLPEKLEEVRYARFDTEQRRVYDGQVVHMKEILAGTDPSMGEDKIKILAELTKIRQICCDPVLLFDDYTGGSTKREACMELITNAMSAGHRMLVFSQFVSMLELLEEDLKAAGIEYYKIVGATPKEKRLKLVHSFNDNDVPVFLISLKAGGTGLNLTGADMVIHYDPWWNLAAQNQATDRAHRIGQGGAALCHPGMRCCHTPGGVRYPDAISRDHQGILKPAQHPDRWLLAQQRRSRREYRDQLGYYPVYRRHDDHGGGHGPVRLFPVALHADRQTGAL